MPSGQRYRSPRVLALNTPVLGGPLRGLDWRLACRPTTLRDQLGELSTLGFVALDELLNPDERDSAAVGDVVPDVTAFDPSGAFEKEETRYLLADSINRLPERDRLVVTLYYFEGLTLSEIGTVLNVTESRVCQIHTKAVLSLRNRFIEPSF